MFAEARVTKPDGGPAFPTGHDLTRREGDGMSLRDYFAGKAMAACLATESRHEGTSVIARFAYQIADAMLDERAR